MPRVKVILHGALKEAYPHDIELEAKTPRILLNGLKLIPELSPFNNQLRYMCKVEGVQAVTDLDEPLERTTVNIYCEVVINKKDITGSGNNPYVRIVIGVILIVISVFMISTGMVVEGTKMFMFAMAMFSAGVALTLGGIMQLLTPKPDADEADKNKSRTTYENTVASGTPISLILGEHLHGGHIFSLNTETRAGTDLDIRDFKRHFNLATSQSWLLLYDGTDDEPIDTTPPGGGGGDGKPPEFNPYYPILIP